MDCQWRLCGRRTVKHALTAKHGLETSAGGKARQKIPQRYPVQLVSIFRGRQKRKGRTIATNLLAGFGVTADRVPLTGEFILQSLNEGVPAFRNAEGKFREAQQIE